MSLTAETPGETKSKDILSWQNAWTFWTISALSTEFQTYLISLAVHENTHLTKHKIMDMKCPWFPGSPRNSRSYHPNVHRFTDSRELRKLAFLTTRCTYARSDLGVSHSVQRSSQSARKIKNSRPVEQFI